MCALLGACTVDRELFLDQVFRCEESDESSCGDGYACNSSALQLGGTSFCAPKCVARGRLEGAVCSDIGERAEMCTPAADACDQLGFSCLRTDLASDRGVCLPAPTCATDDECTDPVRSTCLATPVRKIYAQASALQSDHLFCVQAGSCTPEHGLAACTPGTVCMASLAGAAAVTLPEICVPSCASDPEAPALAARGSCPPAFVCSTKALLRRGEPPFCMPGLLGVRCQSDIDCLVGHCAKAGKSGDRRVCVTDCSSDLDCAAYDAVGFVAARMPFLCVEAPDDDEDARKRCVSPLSFMFGLCTLDSECPSGERCGAALPKGVFGREVRVCGPDCIGSGTAARCLARGGFPAACHPATTGSTDGGFDGGVADGGEVATPLGPRVCVPALWGLDCSPEGGCVGDLTCAMVGGRAQCVLPCTSDADCGASRWVGDAVCSTAGVCVPS
jgi:hypothetical protein